MNNKRIEVGDRVTVNLLTGITFDAIVEYMPVATGDCWILTNGSSGDVHYVQIFSRIVKRIDTTNPNTLNLKG